MVQRAVKEAIRRAEIDIGRIRELLHRKDLATTIIYCHVLNRGARSPLDSVS